MFDAKAKRRRLLRRTITYSVMVLCVITLSTVLILLMLGYRFNPYKGTIQQGGLVHFITQPTGARVSVNDIQLANKTNSKITLNPGNYLVKMEREGYRLWQKNASVQAGTVLRLESARLIPTNLETETVLTMKKLGSTAARNKLGTFALLKDKTSAALTLVDIDNDTPVEKPLAIPSGTYHTGKTHEFVLEAWLNDRYLLVRHTYDKQLEWIVVDSKDAAKSRQITASGKVRPLEVVADPRSSDQVLVRGSNGTLWVEKLAGGAERTVLPLEQIRSFAVDESTVFYTAKKGAKLSTGYLTFGADKPLEIASYSAKQPVQITSDKYFGVRHIVTTVGKEATIERVDEMPSSDNENGRLRTSPVRSLALPSTPSKVAFKKQGQFVVFTQPGSLTTYNIQWAQQSDVPIVAADKAKNVPLDRKSVV